MAHEPQSWFEEAARAAAERQRQEEIDYAAAERGETQMSDIERAARQRVADTPALARHFEVIFSDWANWEMHMRWLCTVTIAEIVSWANMQCRDA
ncbi:MAG: hypothetical protein V2A73_08700 [Pseudomonadota bacterium]